MCGIWAYFLKNQNNNDDIDLNDLFSKFKNISGRGPDNINFSYNKDLFLTGFHRLSIMDTSNNGNQPFEYYHNGCKYICICNGEIYNAENLRKDISNSSLNYIFTSKSDCEVLIPLYIQYGINDMLNRLDGVFAFTIIKIDTKNNYTAFICRDRIGVRPLFIGKNDNNKNIGICSEIKGLTGLFDRIDIFSPGTYIIYNNDDVDELVTHKYYEYEYKTITQITEHRNKFIQENLINAVKKRLISDRPLCALLSGGLDSSLICSIASKLLKYDNKKLYTFSIGLPGSTDADYAKKVSEYIDSVHTVVEISNQEALQAIKDVIWATETYDITTIRASTGQYLISKYISDNTNYKVVLSGDGSDELTSGYIYNYLAPSNEDLHKEAVKRIKEIHLYDGLRADRATSIHGLELRVPFLDSNFVDMYLSIDPKYRKPDKDHMEKHLLRESFKEYLPDEVLWRKKEAFSDGISSEEDSWHSILSNFVDKFVKDEEFEKNGMKFTHCTPKTKEAYFYRKIFDELFGDKYSNVIPAYWMPNWSDTDDPSARELTKLYSSNFEDLKTIKMESVNVPNDGLAGSGGRL